jgi:hypothetical protein
MPVKKTVDLFGAAGTKLKARSEYSEFKQTTAMADTFLLVIDVPNNSTAIIEFSCVSHRAADDDTNISLLRRVVFVKVQNDGTVVQVGSTDVGTPLTTDGTINHSLSTNTVSLKVTPASTNATNWVSHAKVYLSANGM